MRRTLVILSVALLGAGCGGQEAEAPPAPTTEPATGTVPVPQQPPPSRRPTPPPFPPPPARGSPSVPAGLLGREWEALPTSTKIVALTFDAGANAAGLRSIASTLERTGTPATFFLTGRWAEANPEVAAELGARYAIGNHTLTHPDLTTLGDGAVRSEIRRAEDVIGRTTGRDPRPLFRFPYGARDVRTIALVNELGYGSIRWTVDTLGWQGTAGGRSAESVRARVIASLRPGTIVLMHVGAAPDGSTLDADALPAVIEAIRASGYRFVRLDEVAG